MNMKKTLCFSILGLGTAILFAIIQHPFSIMLMLGLIYAIVLEILYNQTKKNN